LALALRGSARSLDAGVGYLSWKAFIASSTRSPLAAVKMQYLPSPGRSCIS
jgi:hypothetical protein